MSKLSQPWYRASRGTWYVTIDGKQINLGSDKAHAFEEFSRLISAKPTIKHSTSQSLPVVIDAFLDWLKTRRAARTFEWYQYRLERLARRYPRLPASHLTIAMVEDWVDEYQFSKTSRRNYLRAIKCCMKWARTRGLIRKNRIRNLEVPAGENREIVTNSPVADWSFVYNCFYWKILCSSRMFPLIGGVVSHGRELCASSE